MIAGLDHVQLAAPPGCEPEARRYFGEVLGLEEVPKPEGVAASGGAWFRCGAQQLHVGVAEGFVPAVKAHPGFAVDGGERLTALAARLGAAGSDVEWDERIPEVVRFFAHDPWGNRLEFRAV